MPLPAELNGRDKSGKFAPGNKIGKGNPANRKMQQLRAQMLKDITPKDVREVLAALIAQAKSGDLEAIREFLNRAVGKADALSTLINIEVLETRLGELEEAVNEHQGTHQQTVQNRWR